MRILHYPFIRTEELDALDRLEQAAPGHPDLEPKHRQIQEGMGRKPDTKPGPGAGRPSYVETA